MSWHLPIGSTKHVQRPYSFSAPDVTDAGAVHPCVLPGRDHETIEPDWLLVRLIQCAAATSGLDV
jgi:hypothetical protein